MSVKFYGRWFASDFHSGHPFLYYGTENSTASEVANAFKQQNNDYFSKGWCQHYFKLVKLCKTGNLFYDDNEIIGNLHHNGEIYITFAT